MRSFFLALSLALISASPLSAKVVVFQEKGFPTVDSEPVSIATLRAALGSDVTFAGISDLLKPDTLRDSNLLVMPYGSAVPIEAWDSISSYIKGGGNLLVIGGQPLHVPVAGQEGSFKKEFSQDTFARVLDFRHTYTVPVSADARFAWRAGYSFLPTISIEAKSFFTVEGRLNGLGYMQSADGMKLASPVIVADHLGGFAGESMLGSRIVALDFDPKAGYWESNNGTTLIKAAATYAEQGATRFWTEAQYSAIRPDEVPQLTLHLRHPQISRGVESQNIQPMKGEATVDLLLGDKRIDSVRVPLDLAQSADAAIPFHHPLPAGFYVVRATYSVDGKPRESYDNGFSVEDLSAIETGPSLGVDGNFLSLGGKPFFPVGTNYFTTEENGWDFSGARNALVWENDFADMELHGVSFVRTGVWMSNAKFVEPSTGEVNERFLRNVEAYLAAAQRHHVAINFTFFAFTPRKVTAFSQNHASGQGAPPPNPYLDAASIHMEQSYLLSIVKRFEHVPWLCYDLINEPSFSNPNIIFHGNVPNGDPAEVHAWHQWLQSRYKNIDALGEAWSVPSNELGSFDSVPLPAATDLTYDRYGNQHEVRALDYNLFAQDMFSGWVHGMVEAIRGTGSTQLINVGQDEGGVTDRLLNQFYATSGVSFTTNHTYWQDDALLWDSVAAKRPGMPNITGETGYQPVWAPDGTWRYDEFTGQGIEERKWALGFAAGSSGALQWDWAREVDFGIERSDGSAKVWENMMRGLGAFAKEAAPYATGLQLPEVAIVLPQSLQLSVYNKEALTSQQSAVRALYNYDRAAAYAVGEYQMDTLGNPKLIILPSAYGLSETAWETIQARVRAGAVLLISGPFAADAHLHPTNRADAIGLHYSITPLQLRDQSFQWPGNTLSLIYGGVSTSVLTRAELPGNKDWSEVKLGKGRVLFSALPLELNDRLDSTAAVYAYALKAAGVKPEYTTNINDPGILICPTLLPDATLYVLTSETNQAEISFRDSRSGRTFSGQLQPGRAAILLVGKEGRLITNYGWHGSKAAGVVSPEKNGDAGK